MSVVEVDYVKLEGYQGWPREKRKSIFLFRKREYENARRFDAVLLIPTGIGCELGGHDGDANAVARLIGSACDRLITHPNVVNATDYNEMTANTLYVEGSALSRLLMGQIGLQPVRANRILTLIDRGSKRYRDEMRNAVSTARITLGIDSDIYEMGDMTACRIDLSPSGRATGVERRNRYRHCDTSNRVHPRSELATNRIHELGIERLGFLNEISNDRASFPQIPR
ncbi:MAG: DUF3326 domain-containing protein [Chromatiaceae bacterium]|nr:DUF3326 domain-containing protein [Chromatiaceae bacterium]